MRADAEPPRVTVRAIGMFAVVVAIASARISDLDMAGDVGGGTRDPGMAPVALSTGHGH